MNNPSLKNSSVFKHQKIVAGLPDKVFVIALFITLSGAFLFFKLGLFIGFTLSFFFAYIVFKPLYLIHRDDIDAWRIYIKATHSPTYLDSSYTTSKQIFVVKGDSLLNIKDLDL